MQIKTGKIYRYKLRDGNQLIKVTDCDSEHVNYRRVPAITHQFIDDYSCRVEMFNVKFKEA